MIGVDEITVPSIIYCDCLIIVSSGTGVYWALTTILKQITARICMAIHFLRFLMILLVVLVEKFQYQSLLIFWLKQLPCAINFSIYTPEGRKSKSKLGFSETQYVGSEYNIFPSIFVIVKLPSTCELP